MNKTSKAITIGLTFLYIFLSLSPIAAQPDLVVDQASLLQYLRADLLDNNDPCYINEGCVGGLGDRQLIRFTTHIKNIGDTDFVVGTPPADPSLENDVWEYDQCHQHWHYEGYAQYLLFDQAGNELPVGLKNGFCLMDSECSGGGTLQYHCGYQGVSAGCGDVYGWSLDCQWIDVTDVPSGIYRLVNRVNWTRALDFFGQAESNYDNNSASVCIQLSRSANGTHLFQVLSDEQCDCTDNDADGICVIDDCNDNNAALPATPGTNCDDGNANTSNDVILADSCTCLGTDTTATGATTIVACNEITLSYGAGQINMNGLANSTYYFKVHDLNDAWKEVFSCASNCGATQTAMLSPSFYKVKIYDANWTPICDTDITLTGNTGTCADIDGDGICAAADCDDNDANIPTAPGTSCNDGNPNTTTDVIQADGCTCLGVTRGCVDIDGDGVCAIADCDDTDASVPTTPGTSCNDGNANTTTDVIQADACTCLGTDTTTTGTTSIVACNEITITYGNGQIEMLGLAANDYYFKIHDLNDGWIEIFSCSFNCGNAQIANVPPSFYKIKVYNASWVPICDTDITLTGTTTSCTDIDGDGVCAAADCDDTDANLPAIPGTICNDGNAITSNDRIQADGCTCLGITTGCTDIDGDGVCAIADCNDNDTTIPTAPGTNCDDGNTATSNDQIQADGCTCLGTTTGITGTCSDILVTSSPNTITVSGLTAPIEIVKIYNISGGWQQVFDCIADCGNQQTINNLPPGNYIVEVQFYSASWGAICSEQKNATVPNSLIEDNSSTFFRIGSRDHLATKANLELYPNPAKNVVSLDLQNWNAATLEVSIYNHLAQKVIQTQIPYKAEMTQQVPITTLANGLYIVKVSDGEQVMTKKLFVIK